MLSAVLHRHQLLRLHLESRGWPSQLALFPTLVTYSFPDSIILSVPRPSQHQIALVSPLAAMLRTRARRVMSCRSAVSCGLVPSWGAFRQRLVYALALSCVVLRHRVVLVPTFSSDPRPRSPWPCAGQCGSDASSTRSPTSMSSRDAASSLRPSSPPEDALSTCHTGFLTRPTRGVPEGYMNQYMMYG